MIDLEMVRGDKRDFSITVTQDGGALNLDGRTLWFTAKRKYSDPDARAIFQKSSADPPGGITITSAAEGKAEMTVEAKDTSGLSVYERTVLVCDLQVVDTSGNPCTPAWGQFAVLPEVTRRVS